MGIPLERKTAGRPAAEGTSSELLKLVHKGWNGGRSRAAPEEVEARADAGGRQRRRDTDRNRLDHGPIKLNRIMVWLLHWGMIFSENRLPPRIKSGAGFFGIML